jgi:hypothetical protein
MLTEGHSYFEANESYLDIPSDKDAYHDRYPLSFSSCQLMLHNHSQQKD